MAPKLDLPSRCQWYRRVARPWAAARRALRTGAIVGGLLGLLLGTRSSLTWAAGGQVIVSVVATTDVHGHAESLPWLGGHLANLRARRASDGGVLLIDAGDMFQGTLESNLGEGSVIVRGYNALGYAAVAIGNHEFDFGPAGPKQIPSGGTDWIARGDPGDDPRGALKARAAEAKYPFLAANLDDGAGRGTIAWPNVRPYTLVEVAGVRVAVIGVTTMGTPVATHPRNFVGMVVRPLAESVVQMARTARAAGARVVIVTAHAGGDCERSGQPDDLGSCAPNAEIFALARALPPRLVDVIAAGHTHQMVAHRVAGVAIVQAMAEGRAFSRVDLTVDRDRGAVLDVRIHEPRLLCGGGRVPSYAPDACRPPEYEGRPVAFDTKVAAVIAPDVARARQRRAARVGITLLDSVRREVRLPSPLGNLAADLLRQAAGDVDVAFINGGSLRSDLPAGPLDYGRLHEAFPFDDGVARVRLTAAQLAAVIARNLERQAGILSISGITARARCVGRRLEVEILGPDGRPWAADRAIVAATNGYLASGGDGLLVGIATGETPEATPMRDRFAELLARRGGTLRADDPALFSRSQPRLVFPGQRPVRCR